MPGAEGQPLPLGSIAVVQFMLVQFLVEAVHKGERVCRYVAAHKLQVWKICHSMEAFPEKQWWQAVLGALLCSRSELTARCTC